MIEMDVLKLQPIKDMFERLGKISQTIQQLIDTHKPTEMAIEAPFFGKNVQSMLKLGRAQGVAIAVAISNTLLVAEYSPKKIKQSITGNGNANKEQVLKMLNNIMPLPTSPAYFDASDALATAVCHHFNAHGLQTSAPKTKKTTKAKASSWAAFVQQNPNRVNQKKQ